MTRPAKTPWGRTDEELVSREVLGAKARHAIRDLAVPRTLGEAATPELARGLGPTTPWGRALELSEGADSGRPVRAATAHDFTDVGLPIPEATRVARELQEGAFLSFEDACLSLALDGKAAGLDKDKMREKARALTEHQVES